MYTGTDRSKSKKKLNTKNTNGKEMQKTAEGVPAGEIVTVSMMMFARLACMVLSDNSAAQGEVAITTIVAFMSAL